MGLLLREADSLTMVPEVLAEQPFASVLEAARRAGFTKEEWNAYILAGIAIQNERGAPSFPLVEGDFPNLRRHLSVAAAALGRSW